MKDEGLIITDDDGYIKFASEVAREMFLKIKPDSELDSLHEFFNNMPDKISNMPVSDYHVYHTEHGPFRIQFVPLHNSGTDVIGYMVFLSPLN